MWREGEGKPMPAPTNRFFHGFEADLQHLLAKRTAKAFSSQAAAFRAKKAARAGYQSEGRNLGTIRQDCNDMTELRSNGDTADNVDPFRSNSIRRSKALERI